MVVEKITYEDYLADSTTQKYEVSGSASSFSFSSLCAYLYLDAFMPFNQRQLSQHGFWADAEITVHLALAMQTWISLFLSIWITA